MKEQVFYLQDSRSYVGNSVLWWAKDGNGYTTDLSKAHIYSMAEAYSQHSKRETDIPWLKEYIDDKARAVVDMQNINIVSAMKLVKKAEMTKQGLLPVKRNT